MNFNENMTKSEENESLAVVFQLCKPKVEMGGARATSVAVANGFGRTITGRLRAITSLIGTKRKDNGREQTVPCHSHPADVQTVSHLHCNPVPMGCILPKRQKNLGLEGDIKVYDLQARIDSHPTSLIESSYTVLKYQTPHFRASAKVRFPPISGNDTWQVGWVQGCSNMDFMITYGNLGTSSWEIPALKTGQQRFVSDSDGKHYPWYGCTTEVATASGPTNCWTNLNLRMNDNFHPSITWDIPVRNSHQVKLTRLARDQSFTVWLVAINQTSGQKFVLRTVKWRMQINIAVDGTQPLGKRARLMEPKIQEQPVILESWQNEVAPPESLRAPNANNAQSLIWRPTTGGDVVIVPPVSS